MNENMELENEVMDQANELVELDDESGVSGRDIAIVGAGAAILTAAGYGVYQAGKKIVNWVKTKREIAAEAKRIVAEREAEQEEFDPEEEFEEEIHVVK